MCYNRFRYYSPESGTYISQDPIGLHSGEPNFYAYVTDSNTWVDVFGLAKTPTSKLQSLWKNYTGSKHPYRDIHHRFPEEYTQKFKDLTGIDVNNPKYHYNLPIEKHTKKPGIHTNSSRTGQNWNKTWKGIIDKVEDMNLSKSQNKDMFEKVLKGLARKERISKYNSDAIKNRKPKIHH
ncbi:RHS repeat-associated core domain-containing protein [Cellulophaga lytica]|nr:RHS repeat-associated core domain-containing protein [Cellulophaga lytica]MDO6855337.1 RHS repeat-associated core domain-containing protein [Cellulophaga lytica]